MKQVNLYTEAFSFICKKGKRKRKGQQFTCSVNGVVVAINRSVASSWAWTKVPFTVVDWRHVWFTFEIGVYRAAIFAKVVTAVVDATSIPESSANDARHLTAKGGITYLIPGIVFIEQHTTIPIVAKSHCRKTKTYTSKVLSNER